MLDIRDGTGIVRSMSTATTNKKTIRKHRKPAGRKTPHSSFSFGEMARKYAGIVRGPKDLSTREGFDS
ncbi:hypothetical protein OpiT1DRAFT_05460 [Opitutaceae bacterium TAV1]|nr:hypothetical protein OpiT1DRAFT_05460 [Opitutaceae bacterium TAV1]